MTTLNDMPEILTVQETAKYLRLKRSTAYELIRQGVIPSIRLGRQIRVPKIEVEKLMQENRAGKEKIYFVPSGPKEGQR